MVGWEIVDRKEWLNLLCGVLLSEFPCMCPSLVRCGEFWSGSSADGLIEEKRLADVLDLRNGTAEVKSLG